MKWLALVCIIAAAHGLKQHKVSLRAAKGCQVIKPSADAQFDIAPGSADRPISPDSKQSSNIADKYQISLCQKSDDGMEGEFRITKLENCLRGQSHGVKFQELDAFQSEVELKLGQDEFVFSLEGPEVRALHPEMSIGHRNCEYVLPYKLVVPGKYHVNLVWTRENYLAVAENSKQFPMGHFDLPLGTETFLEFGSGSTTDALEKVRTTGPVCNYASPKSRAGRWVYTGTDTTKMFNKRRARCVDQDMSGDKLDESACKNWIHAHVDYKDYEWIPDNCQPRRFSKQEARECISKSSLLIRGDSHLRHLYSALAGYACDMEDLIKGAGSYHSTCVSSKTTKANSCSDLPKNALCYRQDYFGIGEPQPKLDFFNLTVVNFGQHQADGAHQQTLTKFKAGVSSYTMQLQKQLNRKGSEHAGRFAWHETNALPFRLDHYVQSFKDWRTYHRLQLYNEVTTPAFDKLKVPVIPSYESTLDFSLHTRDIAHYPKSILMPQVHNILALLCDKNSQPSVEGGEETEK